MLEVGEGGCSGEMVSHEGPALRDMAGKRVDVEVQTVEEGAVGAQGFVIVAAKSFPGPGLSGQDGPGARREGAVEIGSGAAEEGSEEPKSSGASPLPSCSLFSIPPTSHGAGTRRRKGWTMGWWDLSKAVGAGGASGWGKEAGVRPHGDAQERRWEPAQPGLWASIPCR